MAFRCSWQGGIETKKLTSAPRLTIPKLGASNMVLGKRRLLEQIQNLLSKIIDNTRHIYNPEVYEVRYYS